MPRDIEAQTQSAPAGEIDAEKLDRFKLDIVKDADVTDDQRDKANEDMRFVNVDGGMWEGFLDTSNDVPDRVKLELDLVSNPLLRFVGEWGMNRVGVEYKPSDAATTDDDAELLNGIYRSDFRDFSGSLSTDLAVLECATCGFGALKLATEFDDEGDPENENQHIEWRPIYNAYSSVYWDLSAQRIDKRDANHCTILTEFSRESFERQFPDEDAVSAYTPDTRAFENVNTTKRNIIYVATRYEVVKKKETVFVYNNLETEEVETYTEEDHKLVEDELRDNELRTFVRKREIIRPRVEKTVFSGDAILKETRRIAGKFIPIIPMYGVHAYVDGVERYRGIVRKQKDGQRLFNMQVSQLAENAASSGQEVPIFQREQVQSPDVAAAWADKNNKPYLVVDPVLDQDGNPIAPGPLGYSKPPALDQSTTSLLEIVPNYLKEQTGFVAGDAIKTETSGKALRALQKRENLNTQVISANIERAIRWSGEVYQAMAAEIYSTQRMVRTLGKDGTDGTAMLQEVVADEETGKQIMSNDLRGKRFMSYADVGPQYDSIREETVEDLKGAIELLKEIPGGDRYMPALLSAMMDNITGVGLEPIKELNRRIMLEQGMVDPETPEEEQMLAQLQQQAQQPNPQQKLIEAAAAQQQAEAREKDASALQKTSTANLNDAKTVETLEGIEIDKNKLFLEAQKQTREQAAEGLNAGAA